MNTINRSPIAKLSSRWKALVVALVALLPASTFAATLSSEEFLAMQPRWEQLAESGETLRIEGRIESSSPVLLRLKRLPIDFRPSEKTLPKVDRRAIAVEITGRLDRHNTKLVFIVSEMIEPRSDADVIELRESALNTMDPQDWFDLADWAAKRGEFFDDDYLLRKAAESRRKGLAVARDAAGDHAELGRLAEMANEFGLEAERREIVHELLWFRWREGQQNPKSALQPLAEAIASQLPGAGDVLPKWEPALATEYLADPMAVFDAADEAKQKSLARIFFVTVKQAVIERDAEPAGANGEEIADRLAAALPERPALAAAHREREIVYRMQRIELATRSEAMALAERLRQRDRPAEATRSLLLWLQAREEAARKDGSTAELMSVAEDYASLLGDGETAARLLVAMLRQAPDSEAIPAKLRQLGYVDVGGEWVTRAEAATRPVDPVVAAMREGRVAANMSPDQVRKTLGKPDRVSRAAGSAQIHEVWVYGEAGRSGLAVHFLRYASRTADAARVVDVTTLAR